MTYPSPVSEPIRMSKRSLWPLRRTLGLALAGQSVVALVLTLAVLAAGAGIEQRLILILGLLLVTTLVIVLAVHLARQILRPLEGLASWVETAVGAAAVPPPFTLPGAAENELAAAVQGLVDSISRLPCPPVSGAAENLSGESTSSTREELARLQVENRQLEDLMVDMERMSTRGKMAGEVAHEINNFLTIIGGNLDIIPMLLAAGKQEKVFAKFAAMKQTLEKIAHCSNGLVGCRDNESEPGPCDLNRQIENLLAFLKPQNRYDGIEFSLHCDPRLPEIRARVSQIQQVLVNLLNNAADAAREANPGGGRIDLRSCWWEDRGQVAISVTDNGTGLSDRATAHVFKQRYSEKTSGQGLGLLHCHKIALAHGGTLSVKSPKGQGATFTLVLPLAADAVPVHPAPAESSVLEP